MEEENEHILESLLKASVYKGSIKSSASMQASFKLLGEDLMLPDKDLVNSLEQIFVYLKATLVIIKAWQQYQIDQPKQIFGNRYLCGYTFDNYNVGTSIVNQSKSDKRFKQMGGLNYIVNLVREYYPELGIRWGMKEQKEKFKENSIPHYRMKLSA